LRKRRGKALKGNRRAPRKGGDDSPLKPTRLNKKDSCQVKKTVSGGKGPFGGVVLQKKETQNRAKGRGGEVRGKSAKKKKRTESRWPEEAANRWAKVAKKDASRAGDSKTLEERGKGKKKDGARKQAGRRGRAPVPEQKRKNKLNAP